MDLSKLDIRMPSFTNGGVVFKPTHLSKQSHASKPVKYIFYPSFPQDTYLCPVETLKSYRLRHWNSEKWIQIPLKLIYSYHGLGIMIQ